MLFQYLGDTLPVDALIKAGNIVPSEVQPLFKKIPF